MEQSVSEILENISLAKRQHMFRKSGILPEEFDALFIEQKNICACCKKYFEKVFGTQPQYPFVMSENGVKKLLCRKCKLRICRNKRNPVQPKHVTAFLKELGIPLSKGYIPRP